MLKYKKRKVMGMLASLSLVMVLTGCGNENSKTKEAMQLVQNLDYAGAITLFDAAKENAENERLIARGKGIAYMGLTEYEQAIVCFKEALSLSSGLVEDVDFDLNYYLAAAYIKNGQFKEAESAYNAILALRPNAEDAYFLRGSVRLELSDYEGAKADFDKVLSMAPKDYDRLIEVYEVLVKHGYKEVGQEYLTKALENGSKDMDVYDSGRIYYYLGEYQKAYIALEEAKEAGNVESYLYLGRAYEATGDYNYASSVYNSYLSKDTSNPEIYNQLGLCEMEKGEYQKALEAFLAGKQIEDNPLLQTMSFNEIVAYEYLGEYKKAAELLNYYLITYPDDEAAKREQDFLSTR
ncbi:MAG: tetratricopeptide repeat protein [Lachnospiraceae bacterium]|nr:tetratricopeptide repeat protein [Lachnospiraceae bacterium]